MKNNVFRMKIILYMLQQAGVMMLFTCFAEVICLKEIPAVSYIPCLLIFYCISYIARCKMPNNMSIFLTHLICVGVIFVLPFTFNLKCVLALVIAWELAASISYAKKGIKPQTDEVPWPRFMFCFVMYLYGWYDKSAYLAESAYYYTLVLLVIYLLTIYVEGVEKYLRSNTATAGLPIGKIIKSNSTMVGITIGLLFICILAGKFTAPGQDVSAIMQGIYTIIGGFLTGLFYFFKFWISLFVGKGNKSGSKKGPMEGELKGPEDYKQLFENMDAVLYPVFYILFLFLIYKLARFIIRKLMSKRVYQGDIIEKLDVNEKKSIIEKKKRDKKIILSGEEKIRRLYKQRIKKDEDIIKLENNYSVREIDKIIGDKTGNDISECTTIYADVRYGGNVADKAMVSKMKKITKT